MKAPAHVEYAPFIILPSDSEPIRQIKAKMNDFMRKLDEDYRLLWGDVKQMDFRELPPHASVSHSRWKFYENPTTGDLELWHRTDATWSKTYWDIIGDVTRHPDALVV